ncbi:flagellar hook protein FlgE [Kordiimonas sediminis]|uniref:Flagellar hook protein FlgE n=1 Tax=Kordiimonas sediminis TaxID=1735581 RepID=A0A919ATP2_9PROT|nr:flagellar hook protein FlgE [Kordiimonas sediminis]GHF22630.1 flagellar hook protein FlgE [Kordiimonas sediminis]
MAFTALAAGVSGLQAFSDSVGVIADNITNVNTVGYKETRSRFSTLVTETSSKSSYSPGGVKAASESLISRQGLLQPTSSATDVAVDGAGFFVVKKAADGEADGEFQFTRAGAFSKDDEGFYKNTAGLYLMGWPLDSTGDIVGNPDDINSLVPINIDQLNGIGEATSEVSIRANFQSTTPINPAAAGYTVGDISADITAGTQLISPDFVTNVEIFDSQGAPHTLVLSAIKTGANTWAYEITFDEATELDPADHTDGLIASGELIFNPDGSIDLESIDDAEITTMNDAAGNPVSLPGGALTFNYADGTTSSTDVSDGAIVFDFGTDGAADGFSQFESISTKISSSVDGAAFGNVIGISIEEAGEVSALFSNGLTKSIFKLPVATFPNPDGLARRQGNAYGVSDLSGEFALQQAGFGGSGTIASNALELSTVDLANEFSELIKVQRAFSASTRIITTSDEILEELTRI